MAQETEIIKVNLENRPMVAVPLRNIDGSEEAKKIVKIIQDLRRYNILVELED